MNDLAMYLIVVDIVFEEAFLRCVASYRIYALLLLIDVGMYIRRFFLFSHFVELAKKICVK